MWLTEGELRLSRYATIPMECLRSHTFLSASAFTLFPIYGPLTVFCLLMKYGAIDGKGNNAQRSVFDSFFLNGPA